MLHNVTPRLYQETILATCCEKNTLVVLPTGMGKTLVAILLAAQQLKKYPEKKILFVAPTKPLVEQHVATFKRHLNLSEEDYALFTGNVRPEKREILWKTAQFIFSTPQGLENDTISSRIDLSQVSLLIIDEAHRAVGDYAYVFLAKQYLKKGTPPKILGLTASPGSDLEKITEVCENLGIEAVEIRTDEDPDVKPYIQEVNIDWIKVILPESFLSIKKHLEVCINTKMVQVKEFGYANSINLQRTELLKLQGLLHAKMSQGEKSFELLKSLSLVAEVMKVHHALELLETQGIAPLQIYFDKLIQESVHSKVKAVKNLVIDSNFKTAMWKTKQLIEENIEHPKLAELKRIIQNLLRENPRQKIIIFCQYRDSAVNIKSTLANIDGCYSNLFFGQAKKGETGLSQKEQQAMLQEFKDGMFQILIATSVAEEGLDIPNVDVVIFYEAIPSAIRQIQRRGRTGRNEKGRVIVLIAKDTRDEGYRWSAFHKEKKMHRILHDLKSKTNFQEKKEQIVIPEIQQYPFTILVDHREKGSPVVKQLVDMGCQLKLEQLQSADYVVSGRVGVEYKTAEDFINSIIDGRLLAQMKELKQHFERPLLIIEGDSDLYHLRNVHMNSIRGMLAAITISFGIPLLQTKTPQETANIIAVIAKREQEYENRDINLRGEKKPLSLKELQEYVISSLPGIGPRLAKPLLEHFGSVKKIVNASLDELKEIELIGEKKAQRIREVLDKEYQR